MHCNDLKCGDIVDFLLHHKVILFYESEGFFGGGEDVGLFYASCSEDRNMGCDEVKWTLYY